MKTHSLLLVTAGLILTAGLAEAQVPRDNSNRPCYDVNIQIDQRNRANVDQDCWRNDSRTMQAGQNNEAMTRQSGDINTNTVRQYEYDAAPRRR